MLYILAGRDEYSLREALRELEAGIGDRSLIAVNTTTLDGQQLTLAQLKTVGEAAPFMGESRLVITIEGIMQSVSVEIDAAFIKRLEGAKSI